MSRSTFLVLNLALAFYNVGTIWAHEIDIFRSWTLLNRDDFRRIQQAHWRKLPYWVFLPVGLALAGSIALLWYHPPIVSITILRAALGCEATSLVLTAVFWGPWQARLSKDPLGSESPYLRRILSTHWLRTLLINAYALLLLAGVVQLVGAS